MIALTPVLGLLLVFAVGDVANCGNRPAEASAAARTAALVPEGAAVLVLGDTAYPFATRSTLESCYSPTWGVHRPTTVVVPGNHDYVAGRKDDLLDYFGPGATPEGFFARQLGDWLVIGLDSQLSGEALERQYGWLEAILAARSEPGCTLAAWHTPVFSSGLHRGSGKHMRRFWSLLDAYGADLVLSGHEHFYEAFEPRHALGPADGTGIRSFVVGTGGARLYGFWRPPYSSRARIKSHGVLRLDLQADTYQWQFLAVGGQVHDAGEARCRRAVPPGQVPDPPDAGDGAE